MTWGIRGFAASLADRVGRLPPFQTAIVAAVWALTLLLISFVIGVDKYAPEGREVGYALTLNWSIGFTLVVPFYYYFLLLAFQAAGELPARLDAAGMLRKDTETLQPNGAAAVAGRWTRIRNQNAIWWLAGSLLGLAESAWEWWSYSGKPLLHGTTPPDHEIDWSVKFMSDGWKAYANSGFSLLIFLQQVLLISGVAFLLYMTVCFAQLVRESRRPSLSARLFPSLTYEPDDPRCGFQVFTNFFAYYLVAGVCLYSQFLLSRLWNVYLRSDPSEVKSLWGFLKGLLLEGMLRAIDNVKDVQGLARRVVELLKELGASDFSGVFVSLGAVLLFFVSLCLLAVVLRDCADGGRRELLGSGVRGAARERLAKMALWPMSYPKLTTLLSFGFLGVLGMLAYQVAILFLGIAAGIALVEALRNVLRGRS